MRHQVTQEQIDNSSNRVDPGTYHARIDKVTDKASKNGNPVMWVNWTITDTDSPFGGTKLPENITMIPEAYWKLEDLFTAIGFKVDENGSGFDSQDLVGHQCRITVADDTYEGQQRSRITKHLPLE